MPLHLTISFEDEYTTLPSTSRIAHCFVRLPVDVAASLNKLEPFAPLVILRLQLGQSRSIVYVAWDGGTTKNSGTLGLHEQFGRALGLRLGDAVTANVAERVHDTPAYPLETAVIRPVSYDDSTSNANRNRAQTEYTALCVAAETLQSTVLANVRVAFTGLVFPLALPGRDAILVRVVAVHAENQTRPPYAVLRPDSRIEVQPPPPSPQLKPSEASPKRFFARVIASPRKAVADLSDTVLRTHAILPLCRKGQDDLSSCVIVSRKQHTKSNSMIVAVPVALVRHSAVPSNCVMLPSSVWHRLQLTPLTPILLEHIPRPAFASGDAVIVPIKRRHISQYPSFSDLSSTGTVYFHGMMLQDGIVLVNKRATSVDILPSEYFPEPWFDPSLDKPDDADMIYIDKLDDPLFLDDDEKVLQIAASNRRILLSFSATSQQKCKIETDSPLASHVLMHYKSTDADGFPTWEETHRHGLLQRLIPSLHGDVYNMVRAARRSLRGKINIDKATGDRNVSITDSQNFAKSFALVVEGPAGSGRTFACTVVAALLRDAALVRTIWIDGRVRVEEDITLRLRRLEEAFHAASDEGPGVVIIDDFDIFCGHATDKTNVHEQDRENEEREQQQQVISEWIDSLMQHKRKFTVFVLISCERVENLPEDLRAPGVISYCASLNATTMDDRAFMFMCAFSDSKLGVPFPEDETDMIRTAELAISLGRSTEGYSARDVAVSVTRAKLQLAQVNIAKKDFEAEALYEALQLTIKTMVPMSQIGVNAREEEDQEEWTWKRIGAASSVKTAIYDALELPALHQNIFRNVPIRLPRGLLLYGPPGCGKTMIAKTAAAESGMRCILVKGAELMGKYIGQSEAEVRRAFERASACAPCVLLFDEFDALAPSRGGWDAGVTDRVVNTLLTCMDGVERLASGVYIIATSSRPEVIDVALLRPGRLDRWIAVDIPANEQERLDILTCHAQYSFNMTAKIERTCHEIARGTNGYTGADLGAIVNNALLSLSSEGFSEDVENGRYGNEGDDERSYDEEQIVKALLKAHQNSRPSLSHSQRTHYAIVMANFSTDKGDNHNTAKIEAPMSHGKKLALK